MFLSNSNIYDGTKSLITSLNNDYTFFSFESAQRKETGFQNPLFISLETDAGRERPPSIESRDDFAFTSKRSLKKQKVEIELFNMKLTMTARTYSNYRKAKVILAPYGLLLALIFILFFIFKIDLVL